MRKKVNQLTDEEKRHYVNLYFTSDYTLREIAAMGGFSFQTLHNWVRKGIPKERESRYIDVKDDTKPQAIDPREAEIARLKVALEKAELRAHALDTMIDIAESKLNIKIRKKAGAKQ
jgi:transposase-like protein